MTYSKKKLLASLICGLVASTGVNAEEVSFVEAIKAGKTTLNFRFRVEDVSEDGTPDDLEATATTLRTRLTFESGSYNGFAATVEFDHVQEVDEVDYNTVPGAPTFPGSATIIDPEGDDLNQAFISYTAASTVYKYGRQRILLDNQRFVGGVGWRQNEQTYDAFSFNNKSIDKLNIFGAYIYNVNRIFGNQSPAGDHKNETILLNAKYTLSETNSLTGYYYGIDNEDALAFSTDTIGLRFAGKLGGVGVIAELANQSEAGDSPLSYSAMYALLEGSYSINNINLKAGYELLGADGTDGQFITPLATLHAFQGWTDKFLGGGSGNITGGIEDIYFNVGTKLGPVNAGLVYHMLASDDSGASGMDDLGSEIGVVFSGKAGPFDLMAKYATYSADDFATDTEKLWLMAVLNF